MKSFKYSLIASALLLAGCGAELQETETVDTPQVSQEEKRAQSLNSTETFYAFPADGQSDVAVNSSVLLSFSHQVDAFSEIDFSLTDSSGSEVAVTETRLTDNVKGITFKPLEALKSGEIYTVHYAVDLIDSNNGSYDFTATGESTFTTRIAKNSAEFAVDIDGMFPSAELPFTTFTSLRLRLTNEVNTDTLIAGETFKFQKAGTSEQIVGDLIAKGRYITFDPASDLEDDASYELIISDAVKDIAGNSFSPVRQTFVAAYAGVRSFSTMNVTDNKNVDVASPYSGESFNAVTIQSSLIGNKDTTYVDADLITELANLGQFKGTAPLVIRKGTIMDSSALTVKVGGEFPAGFSTGNIRMTTISDATGFLIPNGSSEHKYAPKQLRLLMDVAMTTDGYMEGDKLNGKANGGLSQNIMHLEILGTVKTIGTQMIIDAVGEIDLTILGVEHANAQVSFHMESYTADTAPAIESDIISPLLQSSYPGGNTSHFSLGDNINYTYNEPLELASLQGITLRDANGAIVATHISQDGSAIMIDPVANLTSATTYTASGAIRDLAGNPAFLQQSFTTPYKTQDTRKTSPLVEAMLPGYACAMYGYDYGNDIAGRCAGGLDTDQKFNIFNLQQDREIFVVFSQQLDEASLVLGTSCDTGSFRVEVVNTSGTCLDTVPGVMSYKNKILTFAPYENWKDQSDNLYRYSLMTAKNLTKGQVDCSNGSAICSEAGYPLQTTLLKGNSVEDQGGPDMRVPFRAAPADNLVFNPLMMPTTDTNRDYRWNDNDEAVYDGNLARLALSTFGGGITKAKLGCDYEETCGADKSTTYISGFMPTEVGEYDPIHDRIPVKIHAQTLISSDVYVKTTVISLLPEPVPTGTMVMRPLYPVIDGKTTIPEGYITKDSEGKLKFSIDLQVYMDSPYMQPPLNSTHNLHSYVIDLNLEGPVTFLDDGRMNIQLSNTNTIALNVEIETLDIIDSNMTMSILPGAMSLNQISLPMK